jgi:hypothetical protein
MSNTTGHKHLALDQAKLKRAQKILGARSEAETIERALDFVIDEDERTRRAWSTHNRFLRSCLKIDCQPDRLGMFELCLTKTTRQT